jgi:hypothetical protein
MGCSVGQTGFFQKLIALCARGKRSRLGSNISRKSLQAISKGFGLLGTTPPWHSALLSFSRKAGALPGVLITDTCHDPCGDG